LLSILLSSRNAGTEAPMDDQEVRDAAMTLLVAGSETTANALAWTWYLLSCHPRAESRLAEEVLTVLGGRAPTGVDLPTLPFTQAVVMESMRLYPPSYIMGRAALSDCVIGGYRIPAGQTLWISQWLIHRDTRFFHRPEEFIPERWLDGLQDRLPRFAYIPFGGGPRICIGNALASMESILAIAMIAQRFHFSRLAGEPIQPRPSYTLRPGPGMETDLVQRSFVKVPVHFGMT